MQWREEISRAQPPGLLLLGSVLFNVFINVLELRVSSVLVELADDAKLFRINNNKKPKADSEELQEDLTKSGKLATAWPMKFSAGKC